MMLINTGIWQRVQTIDDMGLTWHLSELDCFDANGFRHL